MAAAFTKGSCWGWQGLVPHPGSVRALDVTLEGDRPSLVTLALEPVRDEGEASEVEALLEWGTAQGSAHRAWIDLGRGQVLGLAASRVIVTLQNRGGGQARPPAAKVRASASVEGTTGGMAPVRAVHLGAVPGLGSSAPFELPAFARTLWLARAPTGAARVMWLGPGATVLAEASLDLGPALVPPGASDFVITNPGSVDWADARAVFELAL
ncbi:MAG: hypothetical protein IPG45_33670 [Deltaproteobacteria bacterium]|nr:hypothetical protein [Deltaproteobacteria bacterium]